MDISEIGDNFVKTSLINLQFEGHSRVTVKDYKYALKYNVYLDAKKIEIIFERELVTRIHI